MLDNSHKHPIKMRTFAADLDAERKRRGELPTANKATSDIKIPPTEPVPHARPASFNRPDPERISAPDLKKTEATEAPIVITEPTKISSPTAATSTIPAFHELQRSVKSIQENIISDAVTQTHKKKKTGSDKIKPAIRPNIGYDATVITDTKSDRFQLFPSIIASFKSWLNKLKSAHKKKQTPKYTIPEAERRKGVIQRATSKTGTIFTADSESLREQIRQRRLQEELEDQEPETTWSPYTETGYELLESPDENVNRPHNVVMGYKYQPQIVEPNNPTLAIPKPAAQTPTTKLVANEVPAEEEVEDDYLNETRWASGDNESNNTVITDEQISDFDYPEESLAIPSYEIEEPEEIFTPPTQPTIPNKNYTTSETNTLTITLLIGIIGTVAIFFIARLIFIQLGEQANIETQEVLVKSEPIIANAPLIGVTVDIQSINQIPTVLSKAIASSSAGYVELAIISGLGEELSPSYIFETLHFKTKANLRQSLTTVHFTTINHTKPGLILSFVDEDAVRGGLLQWEPHLYQDLNVFYGDTSDVQISFTDQKINGVDVRVLTDTANNEKIVYGFISESTVLITTNSTEFSQVLSLSQP